VASIGLVLGAGGVVGASYHVGTLAALQDSTGWDPRTADVIVGTSAGSGTAATLRAGLSTADQMARLLGQPMSADGASRVADMPTISDFPSRARRWPGNGWGRPQAPGLIVGTAGWPLRRGPRLGSAIAGLFPAGSVPTDVIGARLRALYGDERWPADTMWICAVRLRDGRRVVFGRDDTDDVDVGTACEASCAIPGFFQPVTIGDDRYVDGGAHSPTNADLLAGVGLDAVVVVSPMSATSEARRRPRIGLSGRTWSTMTLADEVKAIRRSGTPVLTVQPTIGDLDAMGTNPMDPRSREPVARQARESALRHFASSDARRVLDLLT
jgi:NTE family protein